MSTIDVNEFTTFATQVFEATAKEIESMAKGDRIAVKLLNEKVANELGVSPTRTLNFVSYMTYNTLNVGQVVQGRYGGYIKGYSGPAKKNP